MTNDQFSLRVLDTYPFSYLFNILTCDNAQNVSPCTVFIQLTALGAYYFFGP